MPKHSELDYNQITPEIFIGTNACCTTHFEEELIGKGIVADISLESERLDTPKGVKFFLWLPTKDGHAPSHEALRVGVAALAELVKLKKKIYVHCKNGHGRAPTLVAAYLMTQGKTLKEALALLKLKRPIVHPNQEQISALHEFAKKALNRPRP